MRINFHNNLFLACYDDGGAAGGAEGGGDAGGSAGAGGGGAGDAGGSGAGAGTGGGDGNIKDQNHLNSVLKREKEKFRQEREKLAKQLEDVQKNSRLSEEQKASLEAQIEDLRTAHLTTEEKARREKEKLDKEWQTKHQAAEAQSQHWQGQYTDLKIGSEIHTAADANGVIPQNKKFLEAFLKPSTRLVPDTDEEGKPTGTYTAKVKFQDKNKENQPVVTDLTVPEAVKRMKELPEEFGYLFEAHTKGGVGGQSGTPGKKPNMAKMGTAEYLRLRKENPNLVYGQ